MVLIVIDSSKRELFGCSLLARYLASMGIRSVICSRFAFAYYYTRYKPEAVVWFNVLSDLSHIAKTSFVFVLPSESGNGQPDQVVSTHGGTATVPVYPECVDRFFCWGPAMKEVLLETGRWRDEQLVVTGSPATDHWLLPRQAVKPTKPQIGLTTSFRALSNGAPPSKMNYFEWLDSAEIYGRDGTYYLPPEHAESWIFFEASLARVMVGLVRALAVERSETVRFRPHPFEREERYEYLRAITNGRMFISKKGTISEWLEEVSILFTFISGSALDAVVRGVPVISLRGLLDADALRKIPGHFRYSYDDMMWQMEDIGQAVEYVELAAKGKLRPCRDEKGFYEFLSCHFLFPRKVPAAQQVALEIKKTLEGESSRRRKPRRQRSDDTQGLRGIKRVVGRTVCRYVPMFPEWMALWKYLGGLLPGHQDIGFSYQPWRIWERRVVMRSVDRIWFSDGLTKEFKA